MTDWKKLIAAKVALAKRGQIPSPLNTNQRIPPGQTLVTNFPILDLGIRPDVNTNNWTLNLYGLLEQPQQLNWQALLGLPQTVSISDFHCVTRWSQLDMHWQGVLARDIVEMVVPLSTAKFVTMHSYDGYTTNLPLEALLDDDVVIAHCLDGEMLSNEHGGPVRMIVPKRYAWKGAKWLKTIEFHEQDRLGFWEVRGYHNEAFPFKEQRFNDDAL